MKEEKEEKEPEERNQPLVCWYPTPHKVANCLCRCRDCDDEPEDDVEMDESAKWKGKKEREEDSFYGPGRKRKDEEKNEGSGGCCNCCENVSDEDVSSSFDKTSESEFSDFSEVRSSTEISRPSMEKAVTNISKDVGSDDESASDFGIAVVVPARHQPMRRKAQVLAARRAAAAAQSGGFSTTEDSDSSTPISRHVGPRKHPKQRRVRTTPPPTIDGYVAKLPEGMEEQKRAEKPKQTKPKRQKFQKAPEDESDEDDDADVDSDDESDSDDSSSSSFEEDNNNNNDESKPGRSSSRATNGEESPSQSPKPEEATKTTNEEEDNPSKKDNKNVEGAEGEEKKEEPEKKKKKKNPAEERKKRTKKGDTKGKRKTGVKKPVEVPSVRDDDKVGATQSENQSSGRPNDAADQSTSPRQLEEGKPQNRKPVVRAHKKYPSRKHPRGADPLEDLSSTTDDVRSSMDERTESDNPAKYRNYRRKHSTHSSAVVVPDRTPVTRPSSELRGQRMRKSRLSMSATSATSATSESESTVSTGKFRSSVSASESEGSRFIRARSKSIERIEEVVEDVFLGCLTPGRLFAILAIPMVITVGGYEFLIALGAKKGMKTFQVSGVEIITQGFTLTLGAWLKKEGRKCFLHELTWNWLFAFLNAALTICSQLLTVYSLTALPAAVSSSLCAIQPLGILVLETVTGISKFSVSQCLAFKLPPIVLIIAGVALLSVDVLFVSS